MPPLSEIIAATWQGILLPGATAAAVLFLYAWILPKRGIALGSLLAVVLGFLVGNYFRDTHPVQFRLDHEAPLNAAHLKLIGEAAVKGISSGGSTSPTNIYWIPWTAVFIGVVFLLTRARFIPNILMWLVRLAAAGVAARLLVSQNIRTEIPWLWPALTASIVAISFLGESLGRSRPGGWLPLALAIALINASLVILHAHSGKLSDILLIAGGAHLGLAFIAFRRGLDGGAASPIGGVLLPGIALIGYQSTFSDVPEISFYFMGLSPLALFFVWILNRYSVNGRWLEIGGIVTVAATSGYALFRAMQAESLPDF